MAMKRGSLSSSSKIFAEKGNPWLSEKEQRKDFPLSHSRMADTPRSDAEEEAIAIRNRLWKALGKPTNDFLPPLPAVVIDPDMDAFTRAEKRKARERFVDPKGTPTVADTRRIAAGIAARMHKQIRETVTDVKDRRRRSYDDENVHYTPRPFMGRVHAKNCTCVTCKENRTEEAKAKRIK